MTSLLIVVTLVAAVDAAATHDEQTRPVSIPNNAFVHGNSIQTTASSITAGFYQPRSIATALRGKNRWLEVDSKPTRERKNGLFEKAGGADDKHLSNDAFEPNAENELRQDEDKDENEPQQLPIVEEEEANNKINAREDDEEDTSSIFSFDADRYQEVVEKAKQKTLKGGADKKDKEEKENKDKEHKANEEGEANYEENTPNDTDEKDTGKEESTTHFGTWYEETLETMTVEAQGPTGEELPGALSRPTSTTTESEKAPDETTESVIVVEDTTTEKEMMASTTKNPPAGEGESHMDPDSEPEPNVQPPNFESSPMDAASILQGDSAAQTNQAGLFGMTTKDKAGIALGSISLFAMIAVAAAAIRRRRRRQTRFQNMKDLSSYLDLGDDPSDDGATDYALPLYITTPTAAKYAKTNSESGGSDDDNDDNYDDDDISALSSYIAQYSNTTSPSLTDNKDKLADHIETKNKAEVRELDNIVAGICFEAADSKQEDTTSDSIWDHSSAPTLDTTDSVLENLPASAKAQETAGRPSWEPFPSCAVWS